MRSDFCSLKINIRILGLEFEKIVNRNKMLKNAIDELEKDSLNIPDMDKLGLSWEPDIPLLKAWLKKEIDLMNDDDVRALVDVEFMPSSYDNFLLKIGEISYDDGVKSIDFSLSLVWELEHSSLSELDIVHLSSELAEEMEWIFKKYSEIYGAENARKEVMDRVKIFSQWSDEELKRIEDCVWKNNFYGVFEIVRESIRSENMKWHRKRMESGKKVVEKLGIKPENLGYDDWTAIIEKIDNLFDLKDLYNAIPDSLSLEDRAKLWVKLMRRWETLVHSLKSSYQGWQHLVDAVDDIRKLADFYDQVCWWDTLKDEEAEELLERIEKKTGLR